MVTIEDKKEKTFNKFDSVLVKLTNPLGSIPVIFATLESETIPGFFSENVFTLLSGESVEVTFTSRI